MTGSYLLHNDLRYNGLMTDLGLWVIILEITRFRYCNCNEKVVILHTHHRTIW